MGLDFDQTNSLIGTLTATTKQSGSEIGNFLKNTLARLTGNQASSALKQLNVELTDSQGNIRDVIDVYTDVANAMKGLTEVEQVNIVEKLAGKYHISRMQALLNDLGNVDSMYRNMYETSSDSDGSAFAENEKYMQSLQARINLVRVEVEKLALALGEAFLTEGMIGFMSTATKLLQVATNLTSSLGGLPTILGLGTTAVFLLSSSFRNLSSSILPAIASIATLKSSKQAMADSSLQYQNALQSTVATTRQMTIATNEQAVATRKLQATKKTANAMSSQFAQSTANATRDMSNYNNALVAHQGNVQNVATKTQAMSSTMKLGTVAINGMKTAMLTLGGAMLTALPLVAIGIVAEKILSAKEATRQLKESAESAGKEMVNSYKTNQDELDSLVGKYKELEEAVESNNYDIETLNEYYEVQDKIGTLLPSLVTGEDEYGRKLVESSSIIETKIEMLKQQLEIEKEIAEWQAKQDRDERIEGNLELIADSEKEFEKKLKYIENLIDTYNVEPMDINSLDDVTKYLEKIAKLRKEAEKSGNTSLIGYYDKIATEVKDLQNELNGFTITAKQAQNVNRFDFISKLNDTIEENGKLSNNAKSELQEFSKELMALSDVGVSEDLNNAFSKLFINADKESFVLDIVNEFEKLDKATYETFDSIVSNIESSMDSIRKELQGEGLSDDEINAVMSTLVEKLKSAKSEFADVEDAMKKNNITKEEAIALTTQHAEEIEDATDAQKEFADELNRTTSNISDINGILEDYNENGKLSASTMVDLISKHDTLIDYIGDEAGMIQELTRIRDEDIKSAQDQMAEKLMASESFYNNNLKLIDDFIKEQFKFYDGDLKQFATLAQRKADIEVELIKSISNRWKVYYASFIDEFIPDLTEWTELSSSSWIPGMEMDEKTKKAQENAKKANEEYEKMKKSLSGLDDIVIDKIDIDFKSIGTSLDNVGDSAKDSSKKTSDATKESIYITDKYKLKMEELNLQIEKYNKLQEEYPQHSNEYRKALEAELKVRQEQLKVMQAQEKSLVNQIKSGKIAQTGSITKESSSTTTTATRKLSGYDGRISSKQGNRVLNGKSEYHRGTDIALPKGTRLDSLADGQVIAAGTAGKAGARNYHSSYGNMVVVRDKDGYKHLFAHLDKVVVKLGQEITKGTQIGTIGSTGNSTGSHLHYEVSNKNDQLQNSMDYINQARNATVSVSQQAQSTISAIDNTQQAIDGAKSTLTSLQGEILNQQAEIERIQEEIVNSNLAFYDYKRDVVDSNLEHEVAKLKNLDSQSQRYNKTLDLMTKYMQQKQSANEQEIAYIDSLISKGGLSAVKVDELTQRKLELKTAIHELNAEMARFKLDNINSEYERLYDTINDKNALLEARLENLDTASLNYTNALHQLADGYQNTYDETVNNINALRDFINANKNSAEAVKDAENQINDLKVELENLHKQITTKNYEVIVNIKTQADAKIDDIQFEIDRSQIYQGMYDEGSFAYNNEIQKQIDLHKQLVEIYDETRREIQRRLRVEKLDAEQKKDLIEQLEDLSIGYNNARASAKSLAKEMEESEKQAREDIADALIDAYKNYVGERRDEHMKLLEEEAQRAQENHDKIMQQYQDEMDLFRKNVEARLEMIDREEAERSYQKDLDEMEKDRLKIVEKIDLLSIDSSYEAKKKKEDLLEQLAEKDEEIAEHRHQRDIELQKQALNDLLVNKEEKIKIVQDSAEKEYQILVRQLEKQKAYWEKYYTDLLNDERKFAKIREDIMNGHFDKVVKEFEGYIDEMKATMPDLLDTLDGTMEGVGDSIRQNVIDELEDAIDLIDELLEKQKDAGVGGGGSDYTDSFNPNEDYNSDSDYYETDNDNNVLRHDGDTKVLVAKYMTDILAGKESNPVRAQNIRDKAHQLAYEGRLAGSDLDKDSHVNNYLDQLTDEDKERINKFVNGNIGNILMTDYLQDDVLKWAASLDSGGYVNSSGRGVDDKGGKFAVVHPQEVILNKIDTARLLDNIEVSDRLTSNISSIMNSVSSFIKGMSPTLSMSGGYGNITVNFGDVHNATQQEAENFATTFINRINTTRGGFGR